MSGVPSSFTGSPPYIGAMPRWSSTTSHSTQGFSVNAFRGSAICNGSSRMQTFPV